MKKFLIFSASLLAARAADMGTTWLATPDLRNEWSPLVTVFHFGWPQLIVFHIGLYALAVWLMGLYFLRRRESDGGLGFVGYWSLQYFRNRHEGLSMLGKIPKNGRVVLELLGFLMAFTFLPFSVLAVLNNLLFTSFPPWREWFHNHFSAIAYPAAALYAALNIVWFHWHDYRKYRSLNSTELQD